MSDEEQTSPSSGHLGTSWEIAVVTVFIVVILAIIGAVLFQLRRKRKMRARQRDEEAAAAAAGTERRERRARTRDRDREGKRERERERERDHGREGKSRGGSGGKGSAKVDADPDANVDPASDKEDACVNVDVSSPSRESIPLDKPRPTASPARHSKTSPHRHSKEKDYFDHPSQKPPKWYWESSMR